MHASSRRLLSTLIAASLLGVAQDSGASVLTLVGSSLSLQIGNFLPMVSFPQNVSAVPLSVSSGGGSFTEPASIFTGSAMLPTALFTGVPLFPIVTVGNVANGTNFLAQGAAGGGHGAGVLRAGGGFGGSGPLGGTLFLNLLHLINVAVPLGVIGNTGAVTTVSAGAFSMILAGTGWTTGPVTLTGLTTTGVNTVTFTGYDNRTPAHDGVVKLISPFKVISTITANLPGLATQSLTFVGGVPEPGTLALLGVGAAALATLGWRRRRH